MLDYDLIMNLLIKSGIPFRTYTQGEEYTPENKHKPPDWDKPGVKAIQIVSTAQEARPGYNGFYSIFYFRPDGSLIDIGAWE
jgi:hypothetical protein